MSSNKRLAWAPVLTAAVLAAAACATARGQVSDESAPPMLQWFECKWGDMEHRMSDYFVAGYGSVWVPPPSRAYVPPTQANQNSTSAGYDVFDRFDLGKPGATTAFGTEAGFGAVVSAFHRAGAQVYVDTILNHDSFRQTGVQFQQEGGYPGFWMAPTTPITNKQPTSNWGDFHAGTSGGYYQSENPSGARYCLWRGDLVALIDIDQATVNNFVRQPVAPGNPQNLPGGTYFNRVDPMNARFYPDASLGTDTVSNPGVSTVGALNSGQFAPPCDLSARNEPASNFTTGRFNTATPLAGDAVAENATGYLLRWVQWMMDVQHVDGFRLDAIKHAPTWFFDTYYDSVLNGRRVTPDGRHVTGYSFGECVEGNDFTFDRYVRKPNGRSGGRTGDAFGNRDALDLNGAGQVRNIISGGGLGSWNNVVSSHLDNVDDGFNNGSIGMMHIFSHDNGSGGDGSSNPPTPTSRQQGWYAHCYMLFRPGQSEVYYNARGIARTGSGFYPRQGVPVSLGVTPTNTLEPVVTTLVQLSNMVGRGEYTPRWQDNDVLVFERRSNTLSGYSGNCLIGVNDSYSSGYDTRSVTTSFPAGTRLIELTGNATDATVDPGNNILDVVTVGAGGSVTIAVPRNVSTTGAEHNKGYVVYAPALPAGTLAISNTTGTLASELGNTSIPPWARRTFAVPVVTGASFQIQLTTSRGDAGAPNNDNADDNAVFRINEGFQDWNGNGVTDIDYTNAVAPGYEQFVTVRQPLAGTANVNGQYAQTIDATRLPEGMNYISVEAFRHRGVNDAPLFREWRQAVYVDRLDPVAALVDPGMLRSVSEYTFRVTTADRTVTRTHLILNPPATGAPLALANQANQANQDDRFAWSRTLTGFINGDNTVLLLTFEENGHGAATYYTVNVANCGTADFNGDGDIGTDGDIEAFFRCLSGDCCALCDPFGADFNGDGDIGTDGDIEAFFRVLAGGAC